MNMKIEPLHDKTNNLGVVTIKDADQPGPPHEEAKLKAQYSPFTLMTLSFRTDRYGQTVQTQIRLLLEEQSDQGLHCLLSH